MRRAPLQAPIETRLRLDRRKWDTIAIKLTKTPARSPTSKP